ncbi:MAG: Ig-like domain-containing protein, partial [Defluviitaleaceae bacterium]|nr:Ig-like domain-containing protein [Defluviitaleaceae bacterium]
MSKKTFIILLSSIGVAVAGAVVLFLILIWPAINPISDGGSSTVNGNGFPSVSDTADQNNTGSAGLIASSAIGELTMTPLDVKTRGVAVESSFLFESKVPITADQLSSSLTFNGGSSPEISFTVTDQNNGNFLLEFDKPLEYNQVYTMQFQSPNRHPLSFAFQTERGFDIILTHPGNTRHNVHTTTGIEITFSEPLERDGMAPFFSIDPPVSGRFENVGSTYIFVPDRLSFDTFYTVTIAGGANGVRSADGRIMNGDYTFNFRTEWNGASSMDCRLVGAAYDTVLPGEDIAVEIYLSDVLRDSYFTVDIYQIPDADSYINSAAGNWPLLKSLQTKTLQYDGGYYFTRYFLIAEPLPVGFYRFDISVEYGGNIIEMQKWIQVSALSVYSLSIGGDLCIWVNDTNTGLPVSGATVKANGNTARTSSDGTAMIKTDLDSKSVVSVEAAGHETFVYTIQTQSDRQLQANEKFFSYLYTDRQAYKPNDTVKIFGAIKPRSPAFNFSPNDKLVLKIGDMLELTPTLDAYGCFTAELPVSGFYGYMDIRLLINGEYCCANSIMFLDYNLDSYVISGETDKNVYFIDEAIEATVNVAAFDGTPVEGVGIRGGYNVNFSHVTDSSGAAVGSFYFEPYYYGYVSWYPNYNHLWFSVTGLEEYSQDIYMPVVILPSEIMLEYEVVAPSAVSFASSRIDRDKLSKNIDDAGEGRTNLYEPDNFRGSVTDLEFTIVITRHVATRIKTGEYYDFIQKKNVEQFRYDSESYYYDTLHVRTENGQAVVHGLPVSDDPLVYYSGMVNYPGGRGIDISFYLYWGPSYFSYNEGNYSYYALALRKNDVLQTSWGASMKTGESGFLQLMQYGSADAVKIEAGSLLIIPAREKALRMQTGRPDGVPFTFGEDYVPNVSVFGAYFDGRRIHRLQGPMTVLYDYDDSELSFDISFDKNVYAPGETVNAKIFVTDASGAPHRARLLINVVNEQMLRQFPNYPTFLYRWYMSAYTSPYPYTEYFSYNPNDGTWGGGAEMGGDGEPDASSDRGADDPRKNFSDNPAFFIYESDSGGIANVSFKLADNITAWRVSVLGITDGKNAKAGDESKRIVSTLPFYIDFVMNGEFILGDDIALTVKPFGAQFKLNQTRVSYTAELISGGNVIETRQSEGAGAVFINFGKHPVGTY